MLSKCANPQCSAPFHYLHEGRLFEVQVTPHDIQVKATDTGDGPARKTPKKVERYWLCSKCSSTMTLAVNRDNEVLLLPLQQSARRAAAS